MNPTIKTYKDLCEEREKMKSLLAVQRQRVIDDWAGVKHEFEPVKKAFGVIGKFTKSDRSNPLLNVGLKLASDLLLRNFVFAKAGWVTKLAVPFVMKNYSSHLLAEKGNNLFGKLGSLFKKRRRVPDLPDQV